MSTINKIADGVIWTIASKFLSAAYAFVAVPILIGLYGKADYGLIGLALSINIYMTLLDLGFSNTNLRYFSNYLAKNDIENVRRLFGTSITFYGSIGIINALIIFGISFFVGDIFQVTPEQVVILRSLLYIIALNAIFNWYTSCFGQLIQGAEYVDFFSKISFIGNLLNVVVLALTLIFKFSIVEYYAGLVFLGLIYRTILSIRKIKAIIPDISFRPHFDKNLFKETLPYSMNIFSVSLLTWGALQLQPILLGIRCNSSEVADYNIIFSIYTFLGFIGGSFNSAIFPSVTKAVTLHNREVIERVAYQGTKYLVIVISFVTFGYISVSPDVMHMYLGDSFMYLVPWMDIYFINLLGSHNAGMSAIIYAGTDIRLITRYSAFSYITMVIVFWFLIPYYGARSIAISGTLCNVMQMSFYYFYYWPKKLQINSRYIFFRDLLPFMMMGIFVTFVLRMFTVSDSHLIQFLVKGTMFVLIFSSIVYMMIERKDREFFGWFVKVKLLRRSEA